MDEVDAFIETCGAAMDEAARRVGDGETGRLSNAEIRDAVAPLCKAAGPDVMDRALDALDRSIKEDRARDAGAIVLADYLRRRPQGS